MVPFANVDYAPRRLIKVDYALGVLEKVGYWLSSISICILIASGHITLGMQDDGHLK